MSLFFLLACPSFLHFLYACPSFLFYLFRQACSYLLLFLLDNCPSFSKLVPLSYFSLSLSLFPTFLQACPPFLLFSKLVPLSYFSTSLSLFSTVFSFPRVSLFSTFFPRAYSVPPNVSLFSSFFARPILLLNYYFFPFT